MPASPVSPRPRPFFDWCFGVIVPVICLIFDPIVFKGESLVVTGGLFAYWKVFAYTAIGSSILALALWLLRRDRLAPYAAYIAGVFLAAQIASFLLAVILLPFSLIGTLMSGIGLLGFMPFFTAYVFSRQRHIALIVSTMHPNRRRSTLIGALGVVILPLLLQIGTSSYVNSAVRTILTDTTSAPAAVQQLKWAFWCGDECFYDLAWNYYKANDGPDRRAYLASVYHDITGGDIRTKISTFSD